MIDSTPPLRLITYLVPSLNVELFEAIAGYLEFALKKETVLMYESRFNGPMNNRVDLFKANLADIGMPLLLFVILLPTSHYCNHKL